MLGAGLYLAFRRYRAAERAYNKQDNYLNRWWDNLSHAELQAEEYTLHKLAAEFDAAGRILGHYEPNAFTFYRMGKAGDAFRARQTKGA